MLLNSTLKYLIINLKFFICFSYCNTNNK